MLVYCGEGDSIFSWKIEEGEQEESKKKAKSELFQCVQSKNELPAYHVVIERGTCACQARISGFEDKVFVKDAQHIVTGDIAFDISRLRTNEQFTIMNFLLMKNFVHMACKIEGETLVRYLSIDSLFSKVQNPYCEKCLMFQLKVDTAMVLKRRLISATNKGPSLSSVASCPTNTN